MRTLGSSRPEMEARPLYLSPAETCVVLAPCALRSSSSYLLRRRFPAPRLEQKTPHNLVNQFLQPVSRRRQIAIEPVHCPIIIPLQAPPQSVVDNLRHQARPEIELTPLN